MQQARLDTLRQMLKDLHIQGKLHATYWLGLVHYETGNYELKITNTSTSKARDYALAFEVLPPIPGDFDLDYIVGGDDLSTFGFEWLQTGPGLAADLYQDASVSVNYADFGVFEEFWLTIEAAYYQEP